MAKTLDPTRKALKEIGNQWSDVSVAVRDCITLTAHFVSFLKTREGKTAITITKGYLVAFQVMREWPEFSQNRPAVFLAATSSDYYSQQRSYGVFIFLSFNSIPNI